MRSELPTGTVTFLFTDVEGSTKLLDELGAEEYADALSEHRRVVREACAAGGGVEVDTQGDAFFVAFPTAAGALAAARAINERLEGPIRLRMGLHTGTPLLTEEGYVGPDVHRAARIAAAGYGGQILVSQAAASLLTTDLRDLGEHRLKDLSAPERIYQLGDREFPRLRSLYQTNLPVPLTPFLGRERELREIVELLLREEVRLLTLLGPGGTGKTRLAVQAAAAASERYPDGVWWVPLATLRDPGLVRESIARAVGVQDDVAEALQGRRLLLVLDNFEQLISAAPDISALLADCPSVDALVTSREVLQVEGEQVFPVPVLTREDAARLFVARARANSPDFAESDAVATLCARLDDLPLAIELAAARVRTLTVTQLLERLSQRLDLLRAGRDVDPRQRTLRATIDWSYDLLSPQERTLFARLGVFWGGCTLEAAEDVAEADLEIVESLVDKSLLRRTGERYWMLETVREFAWERVEEQDELMRRHAAYFASLVEQASRERMQLQRVWVPRLAAERANIRAALHWARRRDPQTALRIAGEMGWFWYSQSDLVEGRETLEAVVAETDERTSVRARALEALASFAAWRDYDVAARSAEEALAIYRELGDVRGEAGTLLVLGSTWWTRDTESARAYYLQALHLWEQLGAPEPVVRTKLALCNVAIAERDVERAEPEVLELLGEAEASDNMIATHTALHLLGDCALLRDDPAEAETRYRRSLELAVQLESRYRASVEVLGLAMALAGRSRAAEALRLGAAVQAHRDEQRAESRVPYWEELKREYFRRARAELGEEAADAEWEAGRQMNVSQAIEYALTLEPTEAAAER